MVTTTKKIEKMKDSRPANQKRGSTNHQHQQHHNNSQQELRKNCSLMSLNISDLNSPRIGCKSRIPPPSRKHNKDRHQIKRWKRYFNRPKKQDCEAMEEGVETSNQTSLEEKRMDTTCLSKIKKDNPIFWFCLVFSKKL